MKDARNLQEKRASFAQQMAYSPEKLGPNVKAAREHLHITQEAAAQRAQVAIRTYVAWEHGHTMPRGENLEKLAKALKTSTANLLNGVSDLDEVPLSEQLDSLRDDVARVESKLDDLIRFLASGEELADVIERRRAAGGTGSRSGGPPPRRSHVPSS